MRIPTRSDTRGARLATQKELSMLAWVLSFKMSEPKPLLVAMQYLLRRGPIALRKWP